MLGERIGWKQITAVAHPAYIMIIRNIYKCKTMSIDAHLSQLYQYLPISIYGVGGVQENPNIDVE